MNSRQLLALYDLDERINAQFPGLRRANLPHIVRHVSPETKGRRSVASTADEENAADAISIQIAYFAGLGREFEWNVFEHDTPADLMQRLHAHGSQVEDPEVIKVLDLSDVPGRLLQ